ncbi:sensor histidine kinase [Streptomyces sp. H62]
MDDPTTPIRRPDGRPPAATAAPPGTVFVAALREGLIRATRPDTRPRPPVPRVAAGLRPEAPAGSAPAHPRRPPPTPAPAPARAGHEAVLHRFRLALPAVLPPADRERAALTSALAAFARRVLEHAARADERPPGARPFLPATSEVGPHHLVAAVGLLYECALLDALESASGCDGPALPRALAAVRDLADVLRTAQADFWRGDGGWSESRRLARRLHDELGSTLAVALHRVELGESDPAGGAVHLAVARRALDQAVRENHSLIAGLRHSTRTPPLRAALDAFASDLATPTDVLVRIIGDETVAPEHCRRELLLVLREILRNCLAHAGAAHVEVTVRVTRRWVYARVDDDGAGFVVRPAAAGSRAGHGLAAVRERVEDLGGRLRCTSAPGEGTRTELHVPLGARP